MRHERSGSRTCSTAANFPGASATNVTAAGAEPLRAPHRPRQLRSPATRGSTRATGQYEYLGIGIQRGRMREAGVFVQDSWRLSAKPHAQRRPALRRADPVLPAEQPATRRARSTTSAASPGRGLGHVVQPVPARQARPARRRRSSSSSRARRRTTPTTTTSRPASASRGRRRRARACWAR